LCNRNQDKNFHGQRSIYQKNITLYKLNIKLRIKVDQVEKRTIWKLQYIIHKEQIQVILHLQKLSKKQKTENYLLTFKIENNNVTKVKRKIYTIPFLFHNFQQFLHGICLYFKD